MPEQFAEFGPFGAFILTTLWVHGPWSPLLPAAYEPVLMVFGKLYPPLLIAAVGATLSCGVEAINYKVYNWMAGIPQLDRLREKAVSGRLVKLFEKKPFLVVWLFAWTPAPDWAARILGVLSGFPLRKYVLAFLLGRFPKFLFLAWLGRELPISTRALILIAVATVFIGYGTAIIRARRARPVTTDI